MRLFENIWKLANEGLINYSEYFNLMLSKLYT